MTNTPPHPEPDRQPPSDGDSTTCYEQDEQECFDGMCLRTGCRMRNEALTRANPPTEPVAYEVVRYCAQTWHDNGLMLSKDEDYKGATRSMAQAYYTLLNYVSSLYATPTPEGGEVQKENSTHKGQSSGTSDSETKSGIAK